MITVRTNETSRDFYSKIHVGEHATTAERIVNIGNSVQNLISNNYNKKSESNMIFQNFNNISKGKYMLKKSGNCDQPVMGLVECEEAALSLGLSPDWGNGREVRFTAKYEKSIPGESPHEAKKRPYGCTTIGNSHVYWNRMKTNTECGLIYFDEEHTPQVDCICVDTTGRIRIIILVNLELNF